MYSVQGSLCHLTIAALQYVLFSRFGFDLSLRDLVRREVCDASFRVNEAKRESDAVTTVVFAGMGGVTPPISVQIV